MQRYYKMDVNSRYLYLYVEKSFAMGFEPETSCGTSSTRCLSSKHDKLPPSNSPPPACLNWARSLQHLLEDPDGAELFRRYLQSEGSQHAKALDFWFACEGVQKLAEPEAIQQLAKVIYK